MIFNILQADTLAQAAAETVEQTIAAQPVEMSESLFSMFRMGGVLMWVLLALSILAIYLIGKKWWMIRSASKIDANFNMGLRRGLLVGASYAVWIGLGVGGTALADVLFFNASMPIFSYLFIALIFGAVAGMNLEEDRVPETVSEA